MSYQVLARKWRPKNFLEMVGQEHVLRMLTNALENNRLHHAYLFTGTRGVGKTTLGRILAKCLNCETKITANPCGTCATCQAIDSGRFLDLIEIDAASRTKVEDTRELLDNVQYAPTQGRFKIYLIDEVHMLSGHSFNALLKTLEEPPAHVKFLLATTDPKKLPITILSRCLQFNLKRVPVEQIAQQLQNLCLKENIQFEEKALNDLAQAADGSMRDSLSLLDQAIAYCNSNVNAEDVRNMLGNIEQEHIFNLLTALAQRDGTKLLAAVANLDEQAPNYDAVLENLLATLHQIAILQVVPQADNSNTKIVEFAQHFAADEIQLYYQIALTGRRDLPLAASPNQGFEMLMLRMLAFHPAQISASDVSTKQGSTTKQVPFTQTHAKQLPSTATSSSEWGTIVEKLNLTGMAQALATNCVLEKITDHTVELSISNKHAAMLNKKLEERLAEALSQHFNKKLTLQINLSADNLDTLHKQMEQHNQKRQANAVDAIAKDNHVKKMMDVFGATVDHSSIKAIEN